MILARVFPRRTKATPRDALAFIGDPPMFLPPIDAVHVSLTFTWDKREADRLARAWERVAPVTIGGPATGQRGEEFVPGRYVAPGYTITSRGCPNRCWFCSVWKRDGTIRELPINDGWNILDDNLLACSESHVRAVFAMLARHSRPAEFTGGLEAKALKPWHVELLAALKPKQFFFAYDTPDDYEPLVEAGKLLRAAGFTVASHRCRAYVLIGGPKDTFDAAERRLQDTLAAGFFPMAMLWRDTAGKRNGKWAQFQRRWAKPEIIAAASKTGESNQLDLLSTEGAL
jgi:hypothetical protein